MKKNLETGTPLLPFLMKKAVVVGAIGAIAGILLGLFIGPPIIGLAGGKGSIWVFVISFFFGGASSGVFFGVCLGLVIWELKNRK